jgi:hypothetical protein
MTSTAVATNTTTNILVLGAGVVGFGVVDAWLKADENTFIMVVDQEKDVLRALPSRLGLDDSSSSTAAKRLRTILGSVSTECKSVKDAVLEYLGGRPLHHVVSALGCATPDIALSDPDAVQKIKETYDKVFFPNLTAAHAFLPMLTSVSATGGRQTSYTVAGGPFTHHCPDPKLLATSLIGATHNHFGTILKHLTHGTPCRGNTLCCHYAIGYPDDTKSNYGPLLDKDFGPVTDTREWGKTFVRVAKGPERVGFICMHDAEEATVLVDSKEWVWFPDEHKYGPNND